MSMLFNATNIAMPGPGLACRPGFWALVAIGVFLALGAGCDRPVSQASNIPATGPIGNGVIEGRVLFSGMPPTPRIVAEVGKAFSGSLAIRDENIVVGQDKGLKNVIVFLKDAPAASSAQTTPTVLDQVNCVFVPHVLAVQTGYTLRMKSSDAMMHNVHLQSFANPDRNYGFSMPGKPLDIQLALPESPFRVNCDVHPWMTAWIGVFPHPWFAVTDENGAFSISHIPPGTYTLAAWQEVLPQQEQKITVSDEKPARATFAFQSP